MVKKITLIGGSGCGGTNLCKLLSFKKQDFEMFDLKMSKQFPEFCKIGDVRDIESMRNTITGQVVVNLAAIHRDDVKDSREYYSTNVSGAENVALICSEKQIKKIVFTSTVAVYGFAEPGTDEGGPIKPFNEYGRSKFQAEEIFRDWQKKNSNKLIIIRPTVIFGEGNRGNVYNLFNQIALRKFVMIGNGNNKKSIAYIKNIVSFLDLCITSEINYGLFNYIDTPDMTMNELVSQVRGKLFGSNSVGIRLPFVFGLLIGVLSDQFSKLSRKTLPVSSIRIKKFVSSSEFRSSKASLNNFQPPFSLAEGIDNTLNNEFINPDPTQETFITE